MPTNPTSLDMTALFVRTQGELRRHIRRRVSCPDTAADLSQELYLRLARMPETLATEEEARKYLFRMAANLALDHLKVQANRLRLLEEAAPLLEELYDGTAGCESAVELRRLDALLARVSTRQRDILVRARVYGMTYGEIAREIGVSASLVEKEMAAVLLVLVAGYATPVHEGTVHPH